MERSLASMLFLVAAAAFSVAAGGWWMQRIIFTPDDSRETAQAILSDPDIRQEIKDVVGPAASPTIGTPMSELGPFLETQILSTRLGAAMMAPIVEQAHDRAIGNRDDDPVEITGRQMIEIVRDQMAADAPTVTLPVPVIGTLKTFRTSIGWIIPIAAGLGLLALALGLATRPDRRDVLRGLAEWCIGMAAAMLLFGYLIPVHLLTAIDNKTWTHVAPRLALRTLPVVFGSVVIFGLLAAALILASTTSGKRRQFSTPLSVARYRGGDNPGWG